jgi:DNA-binding response OmpR family regulator
LVLVVEDDPHSRETLEPLLDQIGYAAVGAATLVEAFAKLRFLRPRYVVLDLMLPDGSGIEFLRHVRDQSLPVMVLVVTGTEDPALLRQVRALGPEGLFKKPNDLSDLFAWLRDHRGTGPSWS